MPSPRSSMPPTRPGSPRRRARPRRRHRDGGSIREEGACAGLPRGSRSIRHEATIPRRASSRRRERTTKIGSRPCRPPAAGPSPTAARSPPHCRPGPTACRTSRRCRGAIDPAPIGAARRAGGCAGIAAPEGGPIRWVAGFRNRSSREPAPIEPVPIEPVPIESDVGAAARRVPKPHADRHRHAATRVKRGRHDYVPATPDAALTAGSPPITTRQRNAT